VKNFDNEWQVVTAEAWATLQHSTEAATTIASHGCHIGKGAAVAKANQKSF